MTGLDELLEELRRFPPTAPADPRELAELLVRVKSAAGRWADVLYEVHESVQGLAGPRAAAALEIAFRRAEESYTELEIAHSDLKERSGG